MFTDDVSTCKLQHPLLTPHQSILPNPFIMSKGRPLLRPGRCDKTLINEEHRALLLLIIRSLLEISHLHVACIHGYTVHAHTHTVRPPDFIPNSHACPLSLHVPVRYTPPPPTAASPNHDITSTSASQHVLPPILVPRWTLRRKRNGKQARDAMRRSTTVRRSCSFLQGCRGFYFRIPRILPCTLPPLAPLSAAQARGERVDQAFLRRCR
jgi:hypothetical protein